MAVAAVGDQSFEERREGRRDGAKETVEDVVVIHEGHVRYSILEAEGGIGLDGIGDVVDA